MFRWYYNAVKCYVFLSDVSGPALGRSEPHFQDWETQFRRSRWFRRGWTLQELIAPMSVEFFSKDREILGSKQSLERQIRETTGIPIAALRGGALSQFSETERLSWSKDRETMETEDQAYSLLGIFGVHMPLIYGEGRDNAFRRLHVEFESVSKGQHFEDFSVTFSLADVSETGYFVAREGEILKIHQTLSSDGDRRTAILQGLGGIGKTQLTVAYAKRYRDSYSAVLWLNAKDEASLKQSFAKAARRILRGHPSASHLSTVDLTGNLDEVVEGVKQWLSRPGNTRWLAIYDNYDNPKLPNNRDPEAVDIEQFLPEAYQGSIIITTRSSQVDNGYTIKVEKLKDVQDGLKILFNASRRGSTLTDPDAISLAKKLDGLPLALDTAGAYIRQVSISFGEYLRLYEASWLRLQQETPSIRTYQDRALYSTWGLSLKHIKEQNQLAAYLLQLWAYFDNQDLWFQLLRHSDSGDPEWIHQLTRDEFSFNSAVRVLCEHGLVQLDSSSQELIESQGYSMHSCVHSWTQHVLNQEWRKELAKLALKLIGLHVPETSSDRWWITQRRLLPHAGRFSSISKDETMWSGMERIFHNLGILYANQGKLKEAEEMYVRALQGKEAALGPKHTSTLNTVNNLGNLYADQGKLKEAEEMYVRALQGYEEALDAETITRYRPALNTLWALGNLFASQGKISIAETMYTRALLGYQALLGLSSPQCRRIEHDLASLERRGFRGLASRFMKKIVK